jgi:chromosome segregation protein
MRLEKIKLSGFKSFVDATTIPLPSNLSGIVGPNGCGKSNVIDAVRWVMGESSAKHLRGDTMSDVIFNGSSSRKPVGQAVVELLFDNSDGSVTGEYAAYREISLKRVVNREAQSSYFLNGTRCRRKDITDLFLGTGLGSRSYAIIEQGTISRLIEAKPEELRVYIEEAAGISKYKERRRDTENRIRRTRENLDRLADLCEEIEKQCRHLKRQAGVAEKYKLLKAEERQLKSQLLALRWQVLNKADTGHQQHLATLQVKVDEVLAAQRACEKQLEEERDRYNQQRERWTSVQANFYALGSDIAKAEQALQHHKGQLEQQKNELAQAEKLLQASQQELGLSDAKLSASKASLKQTEESLRVAEKDTDKLNETLVNAEKEMQESQLIWDAFTHQVAEPKRQIDVEKTKIDQLERHLKQLSQRIESAHQEQFQHQQQLENEGSLQLQAEHKALSAQQQTEVASRQILQDEIAGCSQQIHDKNGLLANVRAEHAKASGRLASIEVLQASDLGQSDESVTSWLRDAQLAQQPSLLEKLTVTPGWEKAFEVVLGLHVQARCVDDLNDVFVKLAQPPKGDLAFVSINSTADCSPVARTSLINLVESDAAPTTLLQHVHFAESITDAQRLLKELLTHESVITKDGVWLNAGSVSVHNRQEKGSVLSLEKEKNELSAQLNSLSEQISQEEQLLSSARETLKSAEESYFTAQQIDAKRARDLSDLANKMSAKNTKTEHAKQRLTQIDRELSVSVQEQQSDAASLESAQRALAQAQTLSAEVESRRTTIQHQQGENKILLREARTQLQAAREQVHRQLLKKETHRSECALIEQNAKAVAERIDLTSKKITAVRDALSVGSLPLEEKESQLAELLKNRLKVEAQLTEERKLVEKSEQIIRECETQRHQLEQRVQGEKESISASKIDHQEVVVRKQTLVEQLHESGLKLEEALEVLPENADEAACQVQVEALTMRIDRLGPINLTAIEEYDTQSERKQYLDSQQDDLKESLLTLEAAIEKIDRESRILFKQTFEKVNEGFEKRFPKLFGGGRAYLQQMGEDVLEGGVAVMAQPPGKRNSSIHLLSGGEKALTAVALVFAIFDLNPSPFCMLDEVDAPLDEANVERFGELVKEMSKQVQMILITHNKATMEIVQQLAGVTMKEPGVSRLVAVDLEEAAKMAAA